MWVAICRKMLNWPRFLNVATTESTHVIFLSWFVLCLLIFSPCHALDMFWVDVMLVLDLLRDSGGTKHATWHAMFGEVMSIKHGRLHATWHVMFGEVISVKHGRLRTKHVPPEYQERCLNITR
jgi:hypothetical protein